MQHQHPPGRQVGNRIYYGTQLARGDNCKKCLLILFTVLFLLIGGIVTILGHTLKPFWSDDSTRFCSFCEEDNRNRTRNAANCRIVGPIFISIGVLLLFITIFYSKKKKAEAIAASGGTQGVPAQTTMTYNQANQSVDTSCPQPTYPLAQPPYQASQPYPSAPQHYLTGPQPYSSGPQPYPTGPQTYPAGPQPYQGNPQQYPPAQSGQPYPATQQPYPGIGPNQEILPPPPSYDAVAGSKGPMARV